MTMGGETDDIFKQGLMEGDVMIDIMKSEMLNHMNFRQWQWME